MTMEGRINEKNSVQNDTADMRTVTTIAQGFLRAVSVLMLCWISINSNFSWSQTLLRGDQLKTIHSFNHNEFAAAKVVIKTWQETFDARSRFHISFFGYYDKPEFVRGFMQEIKVFDGLKAISVYDWDSADCSLEKVILAQDKGSEVFLIISDRSTDADNKIITPQNKPAPQHIRIFKLTSNNDEIESSEHTRDYFKKIADEKGKSAVCEAADVYRQMLIIFNQSIKY